MKVSVAMSAHNRENFVAQAIESVLMQEVSFDYEIVIGEDCSTDRTRDIVVSFQEKYPDKFHLLMHEKNLGVIKNFASIVQACQGQYIALIDDDDYWTSRKKLQMQVDFLDNHPDCALCFHDSRHFYEDGTKEDYFISLPDNKEVFTLEDLKPGPFIPTSSTMFRRGIFGQFPGWFYELRVGNDWALHILNAQYGRLGYINEVMAATRIHNGGLWNGLGRIQQLETVIHEYEVMRNHLLFLKDKMGKIKLSKFCFNLAREYERQGDLEKSREYIVKSMTECLMNPSISSRSLLKLVLRLYANPLYQLIAAMHEKLRVSKSDAGNTKP